MNLLDYNQQGNRVLGNVLEAQARSQPEQDFLVAGDRHISFADAYKMSRAYAAGMSKLGVGKGDRVCIFMESCPEFALLTFGCNLLGAQWVPINTDYRGEWLSQTINDSKPTLLITDTCYQARVDELDTIDVVAIVVKDGDANGLTLDSLTAANDSELAPVSIQPGDVSAVMWTSGTTGRSKGVMQSHNVWIRSAISAAGMAEFRAGDVVYNCLPLYNSAAWTANIYPALVAGVAVALDTSFSAGHFWERIRYYGATHVFTLGAMHIFLWKAPESPDDADNPLRSCIMTPMPAELHRPFCKRFGIDKIHQGFGQSEIMLLLTRYDDGESEPVANSLGVPASDLEVALLDDHNQPVATGEVGEFCVKPKGEHILFSGYFNDPESTRATFTDGWFHTGDLGRQDDQGNYFFADRKKDLIRYKGRSVSSLAIESVARRHPAVTDVAAFGIPSSELQSEHEIMLAVVRTDGACLSEEDLARYINDNAPYFFVPRYIEFLDALPMTPTQKVRKVELRERGLTAATWDAKAAGFSVVR